MASPSRFISLNIGTQTISVAEFRASASGGLVLHDYRIIPSDGEPVSEEVRQAHIQISIKQALESLGLKGGSVNYAVSAQSVFTRFVKLPTVDEAKVDQIIQFEAQQNVPFPIHEVVWDYQLVHGGESDKMEVVLVAIKSDLLDGVNDSVMASGLRPVVVDVAPMALYNAFRYNYSELGGCSLLVDIGARTTNLIFVETRKVFSRSIPIGGGTITAAVAKELNLPAHQAEERKKTDGYVGLGGAYAEPTDPNIARLSKIIRNTMTRLHAEITRSISFYRAQQQGTQPVRVFLCGGSANLPYMREFFSEKLQMPIEYFNPLRNVAVSSQVDNSQVAKEAHQLGELVGLGLRAVHDCPMELNLQPASLVESRKMEARKPYLLFAGLCIILTLLGWWLYFKKAADIKGSNLAQLETTVSELQNVESQFRQVREEIKTLQASAIPFTTAAQESDYWAAVLHDLNQRLPDRYIWITVLEPVTGVADKPVVLTPETLSKGLSSNATPVPNRPPGAAGNPAPLQIDGLRLRGLYLDNPRSAGMVDQFVENLNQSDFFQNARSERRSDPSTDKWAYDYEILVGLKNPLALP